MVEDGSEDDLGGRDGGGKGDDDGEDGEDGDRMTDEGIDPTGVIDVVTPLHVMAKLAGSDWQNDVTATELQNFFDSLPNEHERAMMHSDTSDALFFNLLS